MIWYITSMVNSWECDVPKKACIDLCNTIGAIWFGEVWASDISGVPELMESKTNPPAYQSTCILGRKSKQVLLSHILLGAFGNCACPCWGHRYSGAILNLEPFCAVGMNPSLCIVFFCQRRHIFSSIISCCLSSNLILVYTREVILSKIQL